MPGEVSSSFDPEWGTRSRAAEIIDALEEMHERLGEVIQSEPQYILNVVDGPDGPAITATLTEREWRLLRFACERAGESI